MHVQKIVSSVLLASMIWMVYNVKLTFEFPFLIIIVLFGGAYFLLTKRETRNGHMKYFISWPTITWSFIGFLVFMCILTIGVVSLNVRYFITGHVVVSGILDTSEWINYLYVLFTVGFFIIMAICLFGVLYIAAFLLTMPEVAASKGYRWTEVPYISYKIVKQRGSGYLAKMSFATLFVWLALIINNMDMAGTGQNICFSILLFIMFCIINSRADSKRVITKGNIKPFKWMVIGVVAFIILFYMVISILFLMASFYFIGGVLAGLAIYFVCYAIVKMRLFNFLKWLLLIVGYIYFISWIYHMWSFLQPYKFKF